MRKFEVISIILILGLLLYRVFVGIEFQVILSVMLTLMAIFYMWFGLFLFNRTSPVVLFDKWKRKQLTRFQIAGSIGFGFLYSFSFITIMYAVNFYAAMDTMILLALIFNVLILGVCAFYGWRYKGTKSFLRQFFLRSFLWVILLSAIMRIPVDQRLEVLYKEYPAFIEAYNDYRQDPDNPSTLQTLKEERSAFR